MTGKLKPTQLMLYSKYKNVFHVILSLINYLVYSDDFEEWQSKTEDESMQETKQLLDAESFVYKVKNK